MNHHQKRKVLFLCTGNSARSILGEYLLRSMDPRFETWSAGADPTGKVHPMAVQVLREVYGVDATGAESKSWQAVEDVDFDVIITVCDRARETCPLLPGNSAILAHWGSPDPASASGDEAEAAFRRETEAAFRRKTETIFRRVTEAAFRRKTETIFRRVAAQIHRRLERFCALPFDQLEGEELADRIRHIGTEG